MLDYRNFIFFLYDNDSLHSEDMLHFISELKEAGKNTYLLSSLSTSDNWENSAIISSLTGLFEENNLVKDESIFIGYDFSKDIQDALAFGIDCIFIDKYIDNKRGSRFNHITQAVSVNTMRQSDAYTIEKYTDSKILMYRAGKGISDVASWIEPVAIICGKGNNAGDGFVVADELNSRGIKCEIILLSEDFSEDGKYYYDIAKSHGITIKNYSSCLSFDSYGSILDCIFGTGFRGNVTGTPKEVIDKINTSKAYVVSADINSGLNGDTGEGNCVNSSLTVSIGSFKTGHFNGLARKVIKNKVNIDIGIDIIKD